MKTSNAVFQPLRVVYKSAIDLLYPPRCPICDRVITTDELHCNDCRFKVKYVTQPCCMKCGKSLEQDDMQLCSDCSKKTHYFAQGVAAFSYSGEIKNSMYRFKYSNRREYSDFFAQGIADLKGHVIKAWEPDVLVPVPLHHKRQAYRGYNQAKLIADELGKKLGIPVDSHFLVRTKNTAPQKELNDKERNKNINNAFQIATFDVEYKKIVLVDDIYTTGSTVDECAKVLLQHGADRVYVACACIGRGF